MNFKATTKINLDFLGAGWESAYVELQKPSWRTMSQLAALKNNPEESARKVEEIVMQHFIDGRAPSGGDLVQVTAENLFDLPFEVVTRIVDAISTGGVSGNLSGNSKQ